MPLSRARRLSALLGLLYVGGSLVANPAIHRCPHHDLLAAGPAEAATLVHKAPPHAGSTGSSILPGSGAGQSGHHHDAGPCTCPGPCEVVGFVVPAIPQAAIWIADAAPQARAPADPTHVMRRLSLPHFLPPSTAPPLIG